MILNSVARFADRWIDAADLSLSLTDIGFRQGVVAVERLRTYHGRLFEISRHLDRWRQTVDGLQIVGLPGHAEMRDIAIELCDRNSAVFKRQSDLAMVWLATPGTLGGPPTLIMHLGALPLQTIDQRISDGQRLIVTDVVQPPEASWSRQFKVRCRLHYYLADAAAWRRDPDGSGVLVDADGSVTETSISNLAVVRSGIIFSPPPDQVLRGVTQAVVEDLAATARLRWQHQRIGPDELFGADEVLLMGTDTGLWFANGVDVASADRPTTRKRRGAIYAELRRRFDDAVYTRGLK